MEITINNSIEILISHRMPKVPLSITVDEEVLGEFKRLCNNKDIKISTKVNSLMREWVKNNGGDIS